MEQGYELRLTDIRKAVLEQSQNNELYIPLHGKHTTNPDEEPFNLAQKIQSFFVFDDTSKHDPRVMLLMGDAGSGKSMFSQQLHQQLWKAYTAGDPVPLWIPLPELQNPFECATEEVLKKYGFNDSQISELRVKERFIFIVDGYDELHQFQNCYVSNKWEKWNAKVLITCRSQALYYQNDPDKYFMPFNGEKRLPMLLRKLYVAAFSKDQISAYVKKYQQLNAENKIYEADFSKVPGLPQLINTPFLLHLAVEALPDILANQVDDQKMTQAKLYDIFIERWFTRQVKKLSAAEHLKDTEQNIKQQFWGYCKKLAQQMHEKQVSVIPYLGQKVGGRLFGKQEHASSWGAFFNEDSKILRSACPLKRFGEHHYGFVHASMVEYFATRAMYEEIQENDIETHNAELSHVGEEQSNEANQENTGSLRIGRNDGEPVNQQPRGGIHQRVFALEPQSMRFLADRIEMSEAFKQKMLVILESSRKSKLFAIGAANAISALVKAGVTFIRANLSGIQIPGADISCGYFDQADITNANLTNTQMVNVWLRESNLEDSKVGGLNFGEYPWIRYDDFNGNFDYREDIQCLVMACGKKIVLLDLVPRNHMNTLNGHSLNVTSVQLSPDGKLLASGSEDKTIRIWEIVTMNELFVLRGHEGTVNCVAFSPNNALLVSGGEDLRIWQIVSGTQKVCLKGHEGGVACVQFSPDGSRMVSGGHNTIRIWDVASWSELAVFDSDVKCVAFSPDGSRLMSGCSSDNAMLDSLFSLFTHQKKDSQEASDYKMLLWDLNTMKSIATFPCEEVVNSIAFSPDGERVVCGYDDYAVRIWETASQKMLSVRRGHENGVMKVQFCSDGIRVMSGSPRDSVRVWNISGDRFARTRGHERPVICVRFSLDGKLAVSGSEDNTVRIWEVKSGNELALLRGHKHKVNSAAFSPDGKLVVSGSFDNTVRIWDVESRREIKALLGHESGVNSVAFSPNGRWVVSGSGDFEASKDKTVRIWDISSGEVVIVLPAKACVRSLVFSKDGNRIIAGENAVRIYDVNSGRELNEMGSGISCVVLSPDETLIAASGSPVSLFEVKSGRQILVPPYNPHRNIYLGFVNFQFSPDGKRLLIAEGRMLLMFDINSAQYTKARNFHANVSAFSYHSNGSLIIGLADYSIECWQNIGDEHEYRWQLHWSTNIDSSNLFVEGLRVSRVFGLSDQNRQLLEQRGAIVEEKVITSSAALIQKVAKRTGSPIHQKAGKIPDRIDQLEEAHPEENLGIHQIQTLEVDQEDVDEFEERNNNGIKPKKRQCCVIA